MPLVPRADLLPNTEAYETIPLVAPQGFREYDARWWFGAPGSDTPPELNLLGVQAIGEGLGTLIHELGAPPQIVVGHDFRAYSQSIKQALIVGLMTSGMEVRDIGLALSPMAYFAQFDLDTPCVAMVTASHNDNGWTGVKMGCERPLTFGPDEMQRLKAIVLGGLSQARPGGVYQRVDGVKARYIDDLAKDGPVNRPLRCVVATGNGTAGAFAPALFEKLGVTTIPLDVSLDHSFPRYNPNPESLKMLKALKDAVLEHKADIGFAFDGDGDRCGVVDDEGEAIYADKVGVLVARDFATRFPNARFVADVKSTGLFAADPELKAAGAKTDYWKTGHSYIKRRSREIGALAGFEKSGHYFFGPPIGRGYDDGLLSAIAILRMLERRPGVSMSDMKRSLPLTHASPTMSPYCPDEDKYRVVEAITNEYLALKNASGSIMDIPVKDVVTVNGARVTLEDGTWGLVRASSNMPKLVVVVESPTSEERMKGMFADIQARLSARPEVGEFDQMMA